MEQKITLNSLLNDDNYTFQKGHYLLVKTIWKEDIPTEEDKQKRCRFVLGDGETFMLGIIFLNKGKNPDARNVVRRLKDTSHYWKITNYIVEPLEEHFRIFRGQNKQLRLRACSWAIKKANSNTAPGRLAANFPFRFTHLEEELDNCIPGILIDIIGFVTNVGEVKPFTIDDNEQGEYQQITLASSRSPEEGFERNIGLFDDSPRKIEVTDEVYMILNVKVGEWGLREEELNKSLSSTQNTIILRVANLEQLPERFQQDERITNLFHPTRRSSNLLEVEPLLPLQSQNISEPSPTTSDDEPSSPGGSSIVSFTAGFSENSAARTSSISQNDSMPPAIPSTSAAIALQRPPQKRGSTSQENVNSKWSKHFDPNSYPDKQYNFVNNKEPLRVQGKVKLSTRFMGTRKDTYPMRSHPRGIALIISNYVFERNIADEMIHEPRLGNEKDVNNLQDILKAFKFEVTIRPEVSSEELPNVLTQFKETADKNMDACVVAILSHGKNGLVEMVDGKCVPVPNNIIHPFDEKAFRVFAGKPKLFFIQTCQDIPVSGAEPDVVNVMPEREDIDLENILEFYSATSGTKAIRDPYLGSPFIYVLVDTLMEHAHDTDFYTLLKLVRFRLKNKVEWCNNYKLHCEWKMHGFNKKLFFNPGL